MVYRKTQIIRQCIIKYYIIYLRLVKATPVYRVYIGTHGILLCTIQGYVLFTLDPNANIHCSYNILYRCIGKTSKNLSQCQKILKLNLFTIYMYIPPARGLCKGSMATTTSNKFLQHSNTT